MVLGLLTIAAIPTTIGVATSISEGKKDTDPTTSEEHLQKFHLSCFSSSKSHFASEINNGPVVLAHSKLYIAPPHTLSSSTSHPFSGFYITYPDPSRPHPLPLGLVSTISDEPPLLNWIYVDRETREVKYGNRTQSREHIVGSWGWDAGEEEGGAGGLTLEGGKGAVAVEGDEGWEIRWEDGDGEVGGDGRRKVRVSLERKMVDGEEGDESVRAGGGAGGDDGCVRRTDTNVEVTSATFQRSKKTTGEPERVDKAVKKGAKHDGSATKLEIRGTTIERPLPKN